MIALIISTTNLFILDIPDVHTLDKKTVTPTSRCSENNGVLRFSNSDITAKTYLNGLEPIYSETSQLRPPMGPAEMVLILRWSQF